MILPIEILYIILKNLNPNFLKYKSVCKLFAQICNKIYLENHNINFYPKMVCLKFISNCIDDIKHITYNNIDPLLFILPTYPTSIRLINCSGTIDLRPIYPYIQKLEIFDTNIIPVDTTLMPKLQYLDIISTKQIEKFIINLKDFNLIINNYRFTFIK